MRAAAAEVDEYIAGFPADIRDRLEKMRRLIRKAAPDAEEVISYAIPSYKFSGMLVSFAGYAHHTGFYPGAGGIKEFEQELEGYQYAKGSVQFPHDRPLPSRLITRIVKFRIRQNKQKAEAKKK